MDPIDHLKNSKNSHILFKLAIFVLLSWSFMEVPAGNVYTKLKDLGLWRQAHFFQIGCMIFTMLGLLSTPYIIKYHKSCKTVISQGIWVALPIYVVSGFMDSVK